MNEVIVLTFMTKIPNLYLKISKARNTYFRVNGKYTQKQVPSHIRRAADSF